MAVTVSRGYQTITAFGLESTAGTPVSVTEYIETQAANPGIAIDRQDFTGMHGTRSVTKDAQADGNKPYDPTFSFHARDNIVGNFLYWAMGGGNNTAPTIGEDLPSFTTIIDSNTRKHQIAGCKVNTLTMSSATNEPLLFAAACFGMNYVDAVGNVTTPTYDDQASNPIYMHSGMTLTVDSSSVIDVHSLSCEFSNGLNGDHFANSATRTVVPEGKREIGLTLNLDWDSVPMTDRGVWTKFLSGATASISAQYSDGSNTLTFAWPYVVYTGVPVDISDAGDITSDVPARACASAPGTRDEMTVTLA